MTLFLPHNLKKYNGEIRVNKRAGMERFDVRIQQLSHYRTFDSFPDALAHIQEVNLLENLPIKNLVTLYEDEFGEAICSCDLGQSKSMLFSPEDATLVDNHIIYYEAGNAYVKSNGLKARFMVLIAPPVPREGDNLILTTRNGDPLDLRRENVYWTKPGIYKIDRPCFRNNHSTGLLGISKRREIISNGKAKNRFVVSWRSGGHKHTKSFHFNEEVEGDEERARNLAIEKRRTALLSNGVI